MWDTSATVSCLYLETEKQSKTQYEGIFVCNLSSYHFLQTVAASCHQEVKIHENVSSKKALWSQK